MPVNTGISNQQISIQIQLNLAKAQIADEFDGYIADIASSEGRKTYLNILIYSGNFMGKDNAKPSPYFKLAEVRPSVDPAFNPFNGNDISEDQNVHIKAKISGYSLNQQLLYMSVIEISPR